MNRLSVERRAQVLALLTEGCGINSVVRLTGTAKTTVLRLLAEAGQFSEVYHAYRLRDALHCARIEADEIWAFCHSRPRNARHRGHGAVWTFTAVDPETKLMVAWAAGDRSKETATTLLEQLADRVVNRFELRTDGFDGYIEAVRAVYGWRLDYAQLVKVFNPDEPANKQKRRVMGNPDLSTLSTSIVERANLGMRHRMRRFTRKTMGFSKKVENHAHMVSLHFLVCNFALPHGTLTRRADGVPTTPAMAAGLARRPWSMLELAERMDGSYQVAA